MAEHRPVEFEYGGETERGRFHGFFSKGCETQSVILAVVEMEDGAVREVPSYQMRFTDRTPASEPVEQDSRWLSLKVGAKFRVVSASRESDGVINGDILICTPWSHKDNRGYVLTSTHSGCSVYVRNEEVEATL